VVNVDPHPHPGPQDFFYRSSFVKGHKFLLAALIFLLLSPSAEAGLTQATHDVKETAVHVAKKTGEAAREAGHATARAAKTVAHGVASAARAGYKATKRAVDKTK
jgi:hypothetical protein